MNGLLIDKYNDISNPNDLYKFIVNNIEFVVYEYGLPKRYIGVNEYIDFCLNSNKLNI